MREWNKGIALFFLLLFLQLNFLVDWVDSSAAGEAEEEKCLNENDDGTCTSAPTPKKDPKAEEKGSEPSWFDEATRKGNKFLKENVFGQKSAAGAENRLQSFSDLLTPSSKKGRSSSSSHNDDDDAGWNWVFEIGFLKEAESTLLEISNIVNTYDTAAIVQPMASGMLGVSQIVDSYDTAAIAEPTTTSSSAGESSSSSSSSSSSRDDGDDANDASKEDDEESSYVKILNYVAQKSTETGESEENIRGIHTMIGLFQKSFEEALEHLQRSELAGLWNDAKETFSDVFMTAAFFFYLRKDEEVKNAVWKRRKHFFYPTMDDTATLDKFHSVLFLSHIAYADSKDLVRKGLEQFENNTWYPLYITTEGVPTEPAHFIAIRKETGAITQQQQRNTPSLWKRLLKTASNNDGDKNSIDIMIVVRGTKELGDVASDVLCEPADYRGYKAHSGIMNSAKYLVQKHVGMLRQLVEVSNREKINLFVAGHSLGAGTAAIAAIEFNEHDFIEARSIGFGTPAVLSPELSGRYKDVITTVVSDADIVPRMSMASFANLFLDMADYDWTFMALEDIEPFLRNLQTKVPFGDKLLPDEKIAEFLLWMRTHLDQKVSRKITARLSASRRGAVGATSSSSLTTATNNDNKNRIPVPLIPPGNCIHFFRNGVGYTASHTPCDFFSEIEFVPTCIDDHLIAPGYHKLMLGVARDLTNDLHFDFRHDILSFKLT